MVDPTAMNPESSSSAQPTKASKASAQPDQPLPTSMPIVQGSHAGELPHALQAKSQPGLGRIARAAVYSYQGIKAVWRHEAAFRQEVALMVPATFLAVWLAPGRWQLLALLGSMLAVLVVELLNSAIEALADAVSLENVELLGRAKDIGSAAVMLSLLFAGLTWLTVFWP